MTQDEFTIEALRRLPVAASLIAVSAIICSEERMAKIFSEHRGRSYESNGDTALFRGGVDRANKVFD